MKSRDIVFLIDFNQGKQEANRLYIGYRYPKDVLVINTYGEFFDTLNYLGVKLLDYSSFVENFRLINGNIKVYNNYVRLYFGLTEDLI